MTKRQLQTLSKPLICNIEVARAFIQEHKTQTRRLPKSETSDPRYKVGDILWIREPVRIIDFSPVGNYGGSWNDEDLYTYQYVADENIRCSEEIPERFGSIPIWIKRCHGVPNGCIKEMARMFYTVVDFHYEDLQHISFEDIIEEGFQPSCKRQEDIKDDCYEWWEETWDATAPYGKKWEDNPLVEVYKLKKVSYRKVEEV